MRTLISIIVAISALTVMAPGHAEDAKQNFINKVEVKEEVSVARQVYDGASDRLQSLVDTLSTPIIKVDPKEYTCLARNIFFEAANESEEGKVAVGLVTLNRAQDGRFKNTVCGVVDQKLSLSIPKTQTIEKKHLLGSTKETQTIWSQLTICQFSWRCMFVKNPKSTDERWVESQDIARQLLENPNTYSAYREKYSTALYFHATGIRPSWAKQKHHITKIGGHHFYGDTRI